MCGVRSVSLSAGPCLVNPVPAAERTAAFPPALRRPWEQHQLEEKGLIRTYRVIYRFAWTTLYMLNEPYRGHYNPDFLYRWVCRKKSNLSVKLKPVIIFQITFQAISHRSNAFPYLPEPRSLRDTNLRNVSHLSVSCTFLGQGEGDNLAHNQ